MLAVLKQLMGNGGGGRTDRHPLRGRSWQPAASIDLPPFTKISTRRSFAEAYLGREDPPGRCVGPPFPGGWGGGGAGATPFSSAGLRIADQHLLVDQHFRDAFECGDASSTEWLELPGKGCASLSTD